MGHEANLNEFVDRLDRLSGLTGEDEALRTWKKLRLAQAIRKACNYTENPMGKISWSDCRDVVLDVGQIRLGVGIDTSEYSDAEILQGLCLFSLWEYISLLSQDGYSLSEMQMGVDYWQKQSSASRIQSCTEA